ncbi:MAG: hypothetical protein IIC29_03200 [Chloroflexi bacterium]|nr:hypothetical protein [Chloroflexota bacterium]
MQVAPTTTNPVSTAVFVRTGMVLAFIVLLLATGLALAGIDFSSPPVSA